jgi:hypothetical protein
MTASVKAPVNGRHLPARVNADHAGQPRNPGRRRSVPHLALGALLVVVCALGFALIATGTDHRRSVLSLTRPVAVGQRLTGGDLRSVSISASSDVDTISASDSSTIIGQPLAVSLPAGALLTRSEVGAARMPTGQALVAVAVKAGQFPPSLAPGAHVQLILMPSSTAVSGVAAGPSASSIGQTGSGWVATVTDVQTLPNQQGSVVSVLLAQDDAEQVASIASGQINIVVVSGG